MKPWMKELLDYIVSFAVILVVVVLVQRFVVAPVTVSGKSMDYTLVDGEKIMMTRVTPIDRFDIVILKSPNHEKLYIKRVIGVAGDKIEYRDDTLYLNGQAVDEPYLAQKKSEWDKDFTEDFTLQEVAGEMVVPEGKVFVLGDNRQNSTDGRMIGFTDLSDIEGEAKFVYWPFDRFGMMKSYELTAEGTLK